MRSTTALALALLTIPAALLAPATAGVGSVHGRAVVAVIDTGVVPSGLAFQDPSLTASPSTYIPGYPADTTPIAKDLDGAVRNHLYYIPGTRIIGAFSLGEYFGVLDCANPPDRPIYDTCGHGTTVASRVAVQAPDVLLVVVEVGSASIGDGIRWAANQPWIDVITASWGTLANVPVDSGDISGATKLATDRGKIVTIAAGNGAANVEGPPDRTSTWTSPLAGPPWVITVGAVSECSRQDYTYHSVPVDVAAPSPSGGGTSYATPVVAGQFGRLLAETRSATGDAATGPRGGALVLAAPGMIPASGPMADGNLTRDEASSALLRNAAYETGGRCSKTCNGDVQKVCPGSKYEMLRRCIRDGHGTDGTMQCQMNPTGIDLPAWPLEDPSVSLDAVSTQPHLGPADLLFMGYGVVDRDAGARAVRVALGQDSAPERPMEDAFAAANHAVRSAVWDRSNGGSAGNLVRNVVCEVACN